MARIRIAGGCQASRSTDGVMIVTPVNWYDALDRDRALREVRPQ